MAASVKPNRDETSTISSYRIMLNVKNFICFKVNNLLESGKSEASSVDLILSIYQAVDQTHCDKPLCENYVIENFQNTNYQDLRIQFGDINKNDIIDSRKIYLVCYVVANGNFCKKMDKPATEAEQRDVIFRKPVGVAVAEITKYFTFRDELTLR